MSGKTVTRADLAESVFRKVGLSRTESAELVETVIDEICNAIVRGESVKLSSFATFQVRDKNERIGRNPKTGEAKTRRLGLGKTSASHPPQCPNSSFALRRLEQA